MAVAAEAQWWTGSVMSLPSVFPGITNSAKKLGTSLNFFIPIADALKFLAVELVEQDVA